jgi:heptosyltransferase I
MNGAAPQRILIILLGAIGDVTRALPLAQRLRAAYPQAHITWAIEPLSAPLVRHHPAVDAVIVFDRPRGLPAFREFLSKVRTVGADLTLDLQRHLKSGVASLASGAALRVGFHRRNSREGNWIFNNRHIAPQQHLSIKLQQYLAFADCLGAAAAPITFGLHMTKEEVSQVDAMLAEVRAPFVAAFVGSSCESRLWFPERTASLADALATRGVSTVLVGGPGDVAFANAANASARSSVTNLAGQTTLRHLIGIFERCAAAYGPDSGPMHIAAAVGARVVSLWGATSAARSTPWNNEEGVIEGSADCMPCYRKTCPIGRVCMQAISVEMVLDALLRASAPGQP